MSEVEQEKPLEITLPIDWHVPESIIGRYVHNVIVQPGKHEITIFFFENQIPPFVGTPESIRNYLLQKGSLRSECIGKMIVDPELMPDIIEALQDGLKNYHEAKAIEDREVKKMSSDIAIRKTSSTADSSASVPLRVAANDYHPRARILLNSATAGADSKVQAYIRAYHALVPKRTIEEEEADEREWHAIISQPHVQQALRRMAAEARRQYYAGETEEGGFAVE